MNVVHLRALSRSIKYYEINHLDAYCGYFLVNTENTEEVSVGEEFGGNVNSVGWRRRVGREKLALH